MCGTIGERTLTELAEERFLAADEGMGTQEQHEIPRASVMACRR